MTRFVLPLGVTGMLAVACLAVSQTPSDRPLGAILSGPGDDNATKPALVVDAGRKVGRFRGLHRGFSGGFEALAPTEGIKPYLKPIGAASLRVPVLREPGKGQPFFKGTTLADTQDPAMYDFRMIDQFIARIDALGLDILATLAEMPSSLSADGTGKGPPKDPKVFAEMVKHVVLHLTQGWANGHHYHVLRAFEMLGQTPELVEVTRTGGRLDAPAGISTAGDRLTLVVVNWGDLDVIRVQVRNLPWAVGRDTPACTWEARSVDPTSFEKGKALETMASGTGHDSGLDVLLALPSQSVVVLFGTQK